MTLPQLTLPLLVLLFLISVPQKTHVDPFPISKGINERLSIPVGGTKPHEAPPATLAVWVAEPPAGTVIRGTIFCLHGFLETHFQVARAAQALRNSNYRVVLIDARGFGASTGSHITFGVNDALDLSQVVDVLQARKLCGPTVGVFGTSMGAATAILFAAHDPRVTTVVAVAPFAEIRQEVPVFSRNILGNLASGLSDAAINSIANVVSNIASLDLDEAKPIDAIVKTKAHILLIHGDADTIIPHAASEKLHAADPLNSELLTIPKRGHIDLCYDFRGELYAPTGQWFDQWLAPVQK